MFAKLKKKSRPMPPAMLFWEMPIETHSPFPLDECAMRLEEADGKKFYGAPRMEISLRSIDQSTIQVNVVMYQGNYRAWAVGYLQAESASAARFTAKIGIDPEIGVLFFFTLPFALIGLYVLTQSILGGLFFLGLAGVILYIIRGGINQAKNTLARAIDSILLASTPRIF